MTSRPNEAVLVGADIVAILDRLSVGLAKPRRCCDACGCLCLQGESCPACAINATITRRAS